MSEEHRKRILVVDDEADVRAYLSMALEDAGFEVATAADGLDALEIARRNPPDLISLDLIMPRHSGARCYHDLQKDKHLAKIPVLIVTGHARDQLGRADFEEMTMSGPGIYLEKPVSPDSYVSAVRKLLGVETPASKPPSAGQLRSQLSEALAGADEEPLKRAFGRYSREMRINMTAESVKKSGKKILVVDDEPDVVAYVANFLEDHGFGVMSANDGKQGFAKAKAELPDLIVLDIVMPKDTGVRMYRDLYEDAETRHIPVIMLTGIAHEFKRFIGTRRQVPAPAGYFDKPADLNKMLEKIEEILSSRPVR